MNPTFDRLLAGNAEHAAAFQSRFDDVIDGQQPAVVTVSCSDSRVLQDHLWGNDQPGAIFTVGNIGNRVLQPAEGGPVVSGDVLFPLLHTGTDTAVVVGHTGCGAVTATYEALTTDGRSDDPTGIRQCVDLLRPALAEAVAALPAGLDRDAAINRLVEANVDRQIAALQESEAVPESVDLLGVVYDFQDVYPGPRGRVHVVNVDGETDVTTLRERYPTLGGQITRLSVPG